MLTSSTRLGGLEDMFLGLIFVFGMLGGLSIVIVNTMFISQPINCSIAKTAEIFQICNNVINQGYFMEGSTTGIAIISAILYFVSRKCSANVIVQESGK